jgi:hypothetical protein
VQVVQDVRLFYNNSFFDGNNPAGNAADVGAMDVAIVPVPIGQAATPANISGYVKGINGVTFLVPQLPGDGAGLTAGDFVIRHGTTNSVNTWAAGPAPTVTVLPNSGPGGGDRVLLVFPDNSIQDTYGAFQMLATANTGLAATHTAIFGNVRGDTGAAFVGQGVFFGRDAADMQSMVPPLFVPNGASSPSDVNKDGMTNAFDMQIIPVLCTAAIGGSFQSSVIPVITPGFAATPAAAFASAIDEAVVLVGNEEALVANGIGSAGGSRDGRVGSTGEDDRDLVFATFADEPSDSIGELIDVLAEELLAL